MRCYACHQINDAHARFCIECGATLTPTAWAQAAPAEAAYAPPYAPPPPAAHMVATGAAPGMYQPEGAHVNAHAPYGYMPAPAPGPAPYGYMPAPPPPAPAPSLVNNVTVHQVSPPAPPPVIVPTPQLKVRGKRPASDLVVLLAALYVLASGAVIGAMWTTVHGYDGSTEVVAAFAVTVVALLIDIMILARLTRR